MPRFRYLLDPLFLGGCLAYAVNRWLLKPQVDSPFLQGYFNDLWLIPCALPPVLWLHRRFRLRDHDHMPTRSEIIGHLFFWSLLCEGIGPRFMPGSTGDLLDVAAYAMGALLAGLWWQRGHRLLHEL
jgi:hypothetical protein